MERLILALRVVISQACRIATAFQGIRRVSGLPTTASSPSEYILPLYFKVSYVHRHVRFLET
jgi:hypothetical protein